MKALRLTAIVVAIAYLAGCGSTAATTRHGSTAAATKKINLRIGEVVPLTGPLSSFGPSFYKAGQMAVAQATAAAKAAGYPMNITIAQGDEGTSPTTAVSAARKLAAGGMDCLIGGISTGDSIAMAQAVTIPSKMTQIAPTASAAIYGTMHKKGQLTFRTIQTDAFQTLVLAHVMAQELHGAKGKVVSVAGRNDSYGGPATAAFATAWKKLGGKIQGPVLYDPNATSYDSEAAKIVANHPAAYVIEDFPETYAKVGAALLRAGEFSASQLYTTSGLPAQIPKGTPPEALNGATVVQPGSPTSGKMIKTYNKVYASFPAKPKAQQPFNTNNFDATMLCILASAAAHSSNGAAIAKKVISVSAPGGKAYSFLQLTAAFKALKAGKDINYEGASGSLDLNAQGDPGAGLANVLRYKSGNLKLLRQVDYVGGKLLPVK